MLNDCFLKLLLNSFNSLFLFSGEGTIVTAIDKHIKHNEYILRHLTVVRDVKNDIARTKVAQRRERVVSEKEQDVESNDMDQE